MSEPLSSTDAASASDVPAPLTVLSVSERDKQQEEEAEAEATVSSSLNASATAAAGGEEDAISDAALLARFLTRAQDCFYYNFKPLERVNHNTKIIRTQNFLLAANAFALIIKVLFRKCSFIEELLLVILSIEDGSRGGSPSNENLSAEQPAPSLADRSATEDVSDPMSNLFSLLPPGLSAEDYEEEEAYHKLKSEEAQRHKLELLAAAQRGGGGGVDERRRQFLERISQLLLKVHPDALPIETIEEEYHINLTRKRGAAHADTQAGCSRDSGVNGEDEDEGHRSLTILFSALLFFTSLSLFNLCSYGECSRWLCYLDEEKLSKVISKYNNSNRRNSEGGSGDKKTGDTTESVYNKSELNSRCLKLLTWHSLQPPPANATASSPTPTPTAAGANSSGGGGGDPENVAEAASAATVEPLFTPRCVVAADSSSSNTATSSRGTTQDTFLLAATTLKEINVLITQCRSIEDIVYLINEVSLSLFLARKILHSADTDASDSSSSSSNRASKGNKRAIININDDVGFTADFLLFLSTLTKYSLSKMCRRRYYKLLRRWQEEESERKRRQQQLNYPSVPPGAAAASAAAAAAAVGKNADEGNVFKDKVLEQAAMLDACNKSICQLTRGRVQTLKQFQQAGLPTISEASEILLSLSLNTRVSAASGNPTIDSNIRQCNKRICQLLCDEEKAHLLRWRYAIGLNVLGTLINFSLFSVFGGSLIYKRIVLFEQFSDENYTSGIAEDGASAGEGAWADDDDISYPSRSGSGGSSSAGEPNGGDNVYSYVKSVANSLFSYLLEDDTTANGSNSEDDDDNNNNSSAHTRDHNLLYLPSMNRKPLRSTDESLEYEEKGLLLFPQEEILYNYVNLGNRSSSSSTPATRLTFPQRNLRLYALFTRFSKFSLFSVSGFSDGGGGGGEGDGKLSLLETLRSFDIFPQTVRFFAEEFNKTIFILKNALYYYYKNTSKGGDSSSSSLLYAAIEEGRLHQYFIHILNETSQRDGRIIERLKSLSNSSSADPSGEAAAAPGSGSPMEENSVSPLFHATNASDTKYGGTGTSTSASLAFGHIVNDQFVNNTSGLYTNNSSIAAKSDFSASQFIAPPLSNNNNNDNNTSNATGSTAGDRGGAEAGGAGANLWWGRPIKRVIPTRDDIRRKREEMLSSSAAAAAGGARLPTIASSPRLDVREAELLHFPQGAGANSGSGSVMWNALPTFTPAVSVGFAAFTTTSPEVRTEINKVVAELNSQGHQRERQRQRRGRGGGEGEGGRDDRDFYFILDEQGRAALHSYLPLFQQYNNFKLIFSIKIHGCSYQTLFHNCEYEVTHGNNNNKNNNTAGAAKPCLLLIELQPSTSLDFSCDSAGVREAQAMAGRGGGPCGKPVNKLIIGAYLSDMLKYENNRYYGTSDTFLFQILYRDIYRDDNSNNNNNNSTTSTGSGTSGAAKPVVKIFKANSNTTAPNANHYISCRRRNLFMGNNNLFVNEGMSGGSCGNSTVTFPGCGTPLTQFVIDNDDDGGGGGGNSSSSAPQEPRSESFTIINLEVIVMDNNV